MEWSRFLPLESCSFLEFFGTSQAGSERRDAVGGGQSGEWRGRCMRGGLGQRRPPTSTADRACPPRAPQGEDQAPLFLLSGLHLATLVTPPSLCVLPSECLASRTSLSHRLSFLVAVSHVAFLSQDPVSAFLTRVLLTGANASPWKSGRRHQVSGFFTLAAAAWVGVHRQHGMGRASGRALWAEGTLSAKAGGREARCLPGLGAVRTLSVRKGAGRWMRV